MNDTINQVGAGAPADRLREALAGLLAIVDDSRGVAGYHLNGAIADWDEFPEVESARAMLAAAPAQAEQEPVAWMTHHDEPMFFSAEKEAAAYCDNDESPIPLYAAPPAHPDASVLSILRDARESVRYHKGMQIGHEAGKQHAADLAANLVAPGLMDGLVHLVDLAHHAPVALDL